MTSEIRVNKIENRSGLGTVTFADTGVDLAGIVTATTFSGSGASLTNLPAGNLSGTLPAISATNLTNVPAANITGTLPAISAANLTNIPAANVTGTLPALTAANLTNIPAANIVGVCTAGLTKTGGFGKFTSYALLAQVRASDAGDFGSYTTGAWRTRDLDTEKTDEDGIVTLSSNQFTLQAGTYLIIFGCTMYHINKHAIRLQNITDGSTAGIGNPNAGYTYSPMLFTTGTCRVTIASAKTFEVQGYPSTTKTNNGMGYDVDNGSCESVRVEIFKEA